MLIRQTRSVGKGLPKFLSARSVALTIFRPSLISSCLSLLSCDVNVESDTKYIFTKTHKSKYTYDIVTYILLLNCRFSLLR